MRTPTVKQLQDNPYLLYARKVAAVESGNNPNAKNSSSSAGGLHQFLGGTFKNVSDKYKLGYSAEDRFDPKKSEKVFELFTKDNAKIIEPILGRTANDADLYLTHFLGSGGASKFFSVYNQNPNASVATALSPAAIAANKSVVYDKTGRLKTVGELYQWSANKMNITPENVTENFTDYEKPAPFPNFETSPKDLQSVPDKKEEPETEVENAQKDIEQKTNEYNFLQDYIQNRQPIQAQEQQQTPQELIETPDILGQYTQISNFVDTPLMQEGGIIEDNAGQWKYPGQITKIQSSDITMRGVAYPVLGIDNKGMHKLMQPNKDYKFEGDSVTEYPMVNVQKFFS